MSSVLIFAIFIFLGALVVLWEAHLIQRRSTAMRLQAQSLLLQARANLEEARGLLADASPVVAALESARPPFPAELLDDDQITLDGGESSS